jgi:membrane associated rhomboid family serine protease
MIIPLKLYVPMDRRPWVNYALIAVISVTSLICLNDVKLFCRLAGADLDSTGTSLVSTRVSTEYLPLPVLALTSSLLHVGLLHLLGNMWFLWVFGNAVNYKLGQLGYLGFYLAAAMAGGMAHYLFEGTPGAGASGAINGVMGAFLVFFPRNDVTVFWFIWIRPGISTLSSGWIILLWLAWDVLCLALGSQGGSGLWAHVGGFVTGFAVAAVLALVGWIRPSPDEQTLLEVLGVGRQK